MKKLIVMTFAVLLCLSAALPAMAACRWNEDEGIAAEWDGYSYPVTLDLYKGSTDYEANRVIRVSCGAEKQARDFTQTIVNNGPGTYTCVIRQTDGSFLEASDPLQVSNDRYTELMQGHVKPTWQLSNGSWYLVDPLGNRLKGWHKVNEKWYYMLEGSGICCISCRTPDGYYVDETGAWDGGPSIYQ